MKTNHKIILIIMLIIDCTMVYIYCRKGICFSQNHLMALILILINLLIIIYLFYIDKKNELKLRRKTDWLTGGYNRYAFYQECNNLLNDVKNDSKQYVVANLNIINFKSINEKIGEKNADQILIEVHSLFSKYIRKDELLCRNGIDYFLLLLNRETDNEVEHFLTGVINEIHDINKDIDIDFTIGACRLSPKRNLQTAINKASYMMNLDHLKNHCKFYDDVFEKAEEERAELLNSFDSAIKNKEFEVYLQPIVPLSNDRPLKAEALVRWNNPKKGLLYPDKFIPLFEEHHKICKLDLEIFETVCQMIDENVRNNKKCTGISVNLSRIHLQEKGINICKDYYNIKSKYNIPDGIINLEITENSMFAVDDIKVVGRIIDEFHSMGLKVGLDDFGLDFSPIVLLKDFAIDILKLDRTFFIDENIRSHKTVEKLIELSHELGIVVVAEGIEDEDQVHKLRDLNCDYIQGFFYSRPIPYEAFKEWSRSWEQNKQNFAED